MAELQCANSNGYSSPVPIIGWYIAIAPLVCLLLMLSDIFFAIRRKARYIPCRLFSLIAIVSKLPVDLTTKMPSALDQLSKLTGMAMSCISIGFMAPSLASNKRSESISNMASLSIFVFTVAVNICVQLGTGVIFSFVAEHIIIICCMFMLLAILWFNTLDFNSEKASLPRKCGSKRSSIMVLSKFMIKSVLIVFLIFIHVPILAIAFIVFLISEGIEGKFRCCAHKAREDTVSTLDSWRDEFDTQCGLSQRVIMVCVNNMNKWMNVKSEPPPCHHMVQMLSKLHRSTMPKLLNRFLYIANDMRNIIFKTRYKMTCLSMVVLAKVVAPLFPSSIPTKSMTDALREAFEIVYYNDRKKNVESIDSRKQQFAKLLWEGGEIDMRKKALFCKLDSSLEDKVQWKFPDNWPANTSPIFDLPQDSHDTNAQNYISTEDGALLLLKMFLPLIMK